MQTAVELALVCDWSRRNMGTFLNSLHTRPSRYIHQFTQLLNEYSPHEVHLYEADGPGGHANTVHVSQPGKEPVDVDTYVDAFIT